MDFLRGAAMSKGGKPILAMPSRTHHGAPRIVSNIKEGAGVVTTRCVHTITRTISNFLEFSEPSPFFSYPQGSCTLHSNGARNCKLFWENIE